jgi:putative glutamine amidotransferase
VSEEAAFRPLVGIPIGNRARGGGPPRLAINRSYVTELHAAGADVVLLPPAAPDPPPLRLLAAIDGLLLPGGPDVNPKHYGEAPRKGLGEVDDTRDDLELCMVRAAADLGVPIFGICRGQQVVNVALGGTLYQDIASDHLSRLPHATEAEKGRDFLAHAVDVCPSTRLREVLGSDRLEVNSFHHQAVRDVAPGLTVSAYSVDDRVIEGLESVDGSILTVQCHPEELTALAWARALFRSFVADADRHHCLTRS